MSTSDFPRMTQEEVDRHLANVEKNRAEARAKANGHVKRKADRRSLGGFTKVPHTWTTKLATVNNPSTFKVAFHLLYEHWRTGEKDIPLTNAMLAINGIASRETKRRALKELEALGLVTVIRCGQQAPRVRIAVS
jgi:hypothetical protein